MKSAVVVFPGINREYARTGGRALRWCAACWLFFNLTASVRAEDDISLQIGKDFSLFSSGNCRRTEHQKIDLALECQFRGKQAQFYLRESRNTEPPKSSREDSQPFIQAALSYVVNEIQPPDMIRRIKLWGGSGFLSPHKGILTWYGLLYRDAVDKPGWSEEPQKRVLLRAHFVSGYGTAMLVVFSDFDLATASQIGRGVPQEVITMLVSLDLKDPRLPPP